MTFMPRAVLRGGAQVAAEFAIRRTAAAKACVCRHARADHVNQGRCLDQFCDCRQFALPEPEPEVDESWDAGDRDRIDAAIEAGDFPTT